VGRRRELELLGRHLAGDGPPLLLFTGEPGIGKSRLLAEAARRAPEHGLSPLTGGCHRRSGHEPFAPLVGALERHIAALTPEQQRRTALQGCAWLVRLLPELAEAGSLQAPAWALPPEQERRLLFGAVARYLANAAGPAGTLLVLDDLQWAGPDALDLLGALVRGAAERRLRLVAAYRDTEVRAGAPLAALLADLAREGLAARIALAPLQSEEAARLLASLLGDAGAVLVSQVLQRAGGIPFFLVSYAQGLRAGALANGDLKSDVPWSAAETIRQRVLALPDAAQELLAAAAVAGPHVSRALLLAIAASSERPEAEVLAALEAACQAKLLVEEGADAYAFTHDLIREVVGADLSAARRALLHRQVAEVLEHSAGESRAADLAYHYTRAGVLEKAVIYLERSGDQAQALHANADAASSYRELADRLDELGRELDAARAREKLGKVLTVMARYDDALVVLERAFQAGRAAGNIEEQRQALAQIGWLHSLRGTPDEGLARLRPLLGSFETATPSKGLAALYTTLAYLYFADGQYSEQLTVAERAAVLSREAGDEQMRIVAEDRYGLALLQLGRLDEGIRYLTERVIPQCETIPGLMRTQCRALHNVSWAYGLRGNVAQERHYIDRTLALCERVGDPAEATFYLYKRGLGGFKSGDWMRARADFEGAAETARTVGISRFAAVPSLGLGILSLAEGDVTGAFAHLDQALALAERTRERQVIRWAQGALAEHDLLAGRPQAALERLMPLLEAANHEEPGVIERLPLLAWAHLETGDVARAEDLIASAVEHARTIGMRPALADALRISGLLLAFQERLADAEAVLSEALAVSRALSYPYLEIKALYGLALLHIQQGEPERAHDRLEEAGGMCTRLGERPYAEHVERLLAALAHA
jgi:tetratricopeptide (TPR) repeat protein